jgi:sortase (surface protein transpeptidase)
MQISIKTLFAWGMPVVLVAAGILFLYSRADIGKAKGLVIEGKPQVQIARRQPLAQLKQVPKHASIPQIGIDVEVSKGGIDNTSNAWAIDGTHAFYAMNTSTPILYSHNQAKLFSNLRNADEYSRLTLTYDDGSTISLEYVATRFIDANDGSILTENNPDTIILMTCSGIADEMRRIVYFRV